MSAGKACAEREAVEGDSCGAREEGIWMATGIRVRAPCTGRATDEKQKQEKKWQDSYWVGPRTPEREGRGRWRRRTKQGGRRAAGRRGGPSTGQGHPGGAAAAPLPFPGPSPTHYFASERPDCPQDARGPQCAGEADVLLGGRVSFHLGEVSISTGHSAMQRERAPCRSQMKKFRRRRMSAIPHVNMGIFCQRERSCGPRPRLG